MFTLKRKHYYLRSLFSVAVLFFFAGVCSGFALREMIQQHGMPRALFNAISSLLK